MIINGQRPRHCGIRRPSAFRSIRLRDVPQVPSSSGTGGGAEANLPNSVCASQRVLSPVRYWDKTSLTSLLSSDELWMNVSRAAVVAAAAAVAGPKDYFQFAHRLAPLVKPLSQGTARAVLDCCLKLEPHQSCLNVWEMNVHRSWMRSAL